MENKKLDQTTTTSKAANTDEKEEALDQELSNEEPNTLGESEENKVENLDQENNSHRDEVIREENESLKNKLLRALADNENVRKQAEKIRLEGLKYGVQPLARELLNVVDNFERALENEEELKKEPLLEGFLLINKEVLSILEKFKINKINAIGQTFDANFHQAMFEKPTDDYKPGIVCEIVQDGYLFHDRLLRPALVGVAKETQPESNEKTSKDTDKEEKNTQLENTSE